MNWLLWKIFMIRYKRYISKGMADLVDHCDYYGCQDCDDGFCIRFDNIK